MNKKTSRNPTESLNNNTNNLFCNNDTNLSYLTTSRANTLAESSHFNPSPMFKYLKSPLSLKTQNFIESIFIPKKVMSKPKKKTIQTRKIKNIVLLSVSSNHNSNKKLPIIINHPVHVKTKSLSTLSSSTDKKISKIKYFEPNSLSLKYKMFKKSRESSNETNKIVNKSHNLNEVYIKKNEHHVVKKNSCLVLPKYFQRKSFGVLSLPYLPKKRKTISIKNIPTITLQLKTKTDNNTCSVIEDSIGKTYLIKSNVSEMSTKSLHFILPQVFGVVSYSIYGICQGEGEHAYLIASIAKDSLKAYFSTLITYDIPYHPTSHEIYKSLTENNFEVILSTFRRVCDDINNSLKDENSKISIGIVFVVGKSFIFANKGPEVSSVIISREHSDQGEIITSKKTFGGEDKETVFEIKQTNSIKYVTLFSDNFIKFCPNLGNLCKIMLKEKQVYETVNEIDSENRTEIEKKLSLQEKMCSINNYIKKIKSCNLEKCKNSLVEEKLNYSIILLKIK